MKVRGRRDARDVRHLWSVEGTAWCGTVRMGHFWGPRRADAGRWAWSPCSAGCRRHDKLARRPTSRVMERKTITSTSSLFWYDFIVSDDWMMRLVWSYARCVGRRSRATREPLVVMLVAVVSAAASLWRGRARRDRQLYITLPQPDLLALRLAGATRRSFTVASTDILPCVAPV